MTKKLFAILSFLLFCQTSHAANVSALGLEIGSATFDEVRAKIGSRTKLAKVSSDHPISHGLALSGDGQGLDLEGIVKVLLVFDRSDRLVGTELTLTKGAMNSNFREVARILREKYRLIESRVPFVGDSYMLLRSGNSVVEIDAPHLSTTMAVRYMTDNFRSSLQAAVNAEQESKSRRKAANY